ncbi:MAG TPA: (2Fe-2S) ferredoxin domain-containing protein [Leptolyngbyaceae cyanobacterium M65_K2018_010]|nr:(2Fe-2S) ferredoxin domain-containing protein [Leptolyngbyaceae cyanobacterium M65_K2018_010]
MENLPLPTPPTLSTPQRWLVQVCQNRTCLRHRADAVLAAFQQYQSDQIGVAESECLGQCSAGPTVRVLPEDTWYCRVKPADVPRIVDQHLGQGQPVKECLHPRFHPPSGEG